MAPSHITNHVEQAIARLPYDLRNAPNLVAIASALIAPLQTIEDALWQLYAERTVDVATGVTLEAIGRLVGEPPTGLDEETYRRRIKARIRTNRSSGTIEEFITIARLILNDPDARLQLERQAGSAVVVRVLEVIIDDDLADVLIAFLVDAASADGHVYLETLTALEDDSFTLAIAAFLDGALAGGETTIPVDSTAGFPDSGSLDIDVGLAVEETVTYAGKTATSFIGVSAVANAHVDTSCVQLNGGPGKGLGDSTNAATGGKLASARDGL